MIEIIVAVLVLALVLIYQILLKPPAPKICGSVNGPPVTSPRIKLRDGRYLAYKVRGAKIKEARFKVIFSHGFSSSKDLNIPLSNEWLEEFGICLVTYDRPGYTESDTNPNRSPKADAFDIQDLADAFGLGSKFYVIGISFGCAPIWGCLKYIPHRLAGALLGVPTINYWWPSLPSTQSNSAFTKLPLLEQWRLCVVHYAPKLGWIFNRLFPYPTVASVLKSNPNFFNKHDLMIIAESLHLPPVPDNPDQQGAYESTYRDTVVTHGKWEFDPLSLSNPFDDKKKVVQLWLGREDGVIGLELQRYIAKKLPWIECNEVPYGGHLWFHDRKSCEIVFKSLFLGEEPRFE